MSRSSSTRNPLVLWSPRSLIERAARQRLGEFVDSLPGFLLVVRLDDFSSELAAGFDKSDDERLFSRRKRADTSSVPLSLPEQTELSHLPSVAEPMVAVRTASGELSYAPELMQAECYVVSIRKRGLESSTSPVSVGRSPEQDILLQHPSVSRLHAWLDAGETLSVIDAGSRNKTLVNGVVAREKTPLRTGDALKFGAVRCTLCTAASLWRHVNA